MKRFLAFLLLLTTLLAVASCGESGRDGYLHRGSRSNSMVEAETRILFFSDGILYYYDKVNDAARPFCFDPLCEHDAYADHCLATRFAVTHTLQWITFSRVDGRYHVLRGDKLFSFGIDGSDVREDYSFGERGAMTDFDPRVSGQPGDLLSYGKYLYMVAKDSQTGNRQLIRYDVAKKQMKTLTGPDDGTLTGTFLILRDQIYYIRVVNDEIQTVRADLSLKKKEILENGDFVVGAYLSDGEYLYLPRSRYETDEKTEESIAYDDGIWRYDPTDNTFTRLRMTSGVSACKLLYVSDKYLYYTQSERVGSSTRKPAVYRMEKDGSNAIPVFSDEKCNVTGLCVSGNVAVLTCELPKPGGSSDKVTYRMTVAEDGTFSDIRALDLE